MQLINDQVLLQFLIISYLKQGQMTGADILRKIEEDFEGLDYPVKKTTLYNTIWQMRDDKMIFCDPLGKKLRSNRIYYWLGENQLFNHADQKDWFELIQRQKEIMERSQRIYLGLSNKEGRKK